MVKYVLFDFNGTVVDDIDLSLESINLCIEKYLDRPPLTMEEYRKVFTFPVKKYYEDAGFDFNVLDWYEVGNCWMDNYVSKRKTHTKVHDGVVDLLIKNRQKDIKNVALSASKKSNLIEQLNELEIYDYFDEILGIDNIYADSKIPIAKQFMKDKDPKEFVMLGDTTHDKEVADAIGVRCILIANGHQNRETLLTVCDEVYDDIREVVL